MGQGQPAPALPDRVTQVQNLLREKINALSQVTYAVNTTFDLAEKAKTEITLDDAWISAIATADPATLPSPAQDQNLLDAIQAVQSAIDSSAATDQLAAATAVLITAFKAPG